MHTPHTLNHEHALKNTVQERHYHDELFFWKQELSKAVDERKYFVARCWKVSFCNRTNCVCHHVLVSLSQQLPQQLL